MKFLANIWRHLKIFGILIPGILVPRATAQDLLNTGQINNTGGIIRVQGQSTWGPDTVQGTMEFYSGNQKIQAKQYQNLILSGSGADLTVGGDFQVSGNLKVESGILLNVQSGSTLVLGDTLFERGYVQGKVRKSVSLSPGLSSSDFGRIGSTISWSGQPPGMTILTRSSGTASGGLNGRQSILRYYDVLPVVDARLNATFKFKYSMEELNAHNPARLELWRSLDDGSTWRRQGGVVDTAQRTITKTGIVQFSRWTAADTSHLLGPVQYEWKADSLLYVSGDTQKTYRHIALQPFVVRLKDFFGNWLEDDTVSFAIAGNAKGATLSVSKAVTDSNGYASTSLTLGDSVGTYTVLASHSKIPGRTVSFTAAALPSRVATAMQLTAGDTQPAAPIFTPLSAFVVTTLDADAIPTFGDTVQFSIASTPLNAQGQSLSTAFGITDINGHASTILKLGSKVGTYTVKAVFHGLAPITFTARAVNGAPNTVVKIDSSDKQVRQIGDTLKTPFVLSVADTGANPVSGARVKFIVSAPAGAQNYRLTADSAATDSLGKTSVRLILGSKPGVYTVSATVANLPSISFTARGFFLAGDANSDENFNVADITAIVDHINRHKLLSGLDSMRADINGDGVINADDITSIRNDLLNEVIHSDSGTAASPCVNQPATGALLQTKDNLLAKSVDVQTPLANGTLEITGAGIRLNLTNHIPVTGIQVDARFSLNVNVEAPELIFERAHNMNVYVHSIGSRMHILAYNLANTPIDTGEGTLLRIPLKLSTVSQIENIRVVVSTVNDQALSFAGGKSLALPGVTYPSHYTLYQNYPNPFNSSTVIRFDVPDIQGRFAKVMIEVFDLLGREIKTLYLGEVETGFGKTVTWDGTDNSGIHMTSGVYFYRLISREHMSVKKMIYLK